MKVKEESENIGLKLNIQKTKIMASGPQNSPKKITESVRSQSGWEYLIEWVVFP